MSAEATSKLRPEMAESPNLAPETPDNNPSGNFRSLVPGSDILLADVDRDALANRISPTSLTNGLTSSEVQSSLAKHGFNEVITPKPSKLMMFLMFFWGPMPWLIEIAAILSIWLQDWAQVVIVLLLLLVNATVGFHEQQQAGDAVETLQKSLALSSRVLRDGKTALIPARELVPGDIIFLKGGDVVPADAVVVPLPGSSVGTATLTVDQSALTGESLPVVVRNGGALLSSSLVKTGEVQAQVTATGRNTVIGKASVLVGESGKQLSKSGIKATMLKLTNILLVVAFSIVTVTFLFGILEHKPFVELLQLSLVIIIAAIPVAMPTVTTVTLAVGAHSLAGANAVVTKLESLEQLASVDILCSDKTGTLTQNRLSLRDCVTDNASVTLDEMLDAALFCSSNFDDAIDSVFLQAGKQRAAGAVWVGPTANPAVSMSASSDSSSPNQGAHPVEPAVTILAKVPFNPAVKLTEALVQDNRDSGAAPKVYRVCKGATHVISKLCKVEGSDLEATVNLIASRGYRSVAVARSSSTNMSDPDPEWTLLGLFAVYDPPRVDSKMVVEQLSQLGVSVKVLTGDQSIIGKEVAGLIGLGRNIVTASELFNDTLSLANKVEQAERLDGLGEVFPEHKYEFVKLLQSAGHVVAMTGDGVNDAPAIQVANCGIAVEGATPAAQSAAAVVLLDQGLSSIVHAIRESRKIFSRLSSYVVFRTLDSLHVLFFLAVSILFLDFELTSRQVLLLALLNDLSLVSIAYDRARESPRPLRWNLPLFLSAATIMSVLMIASTVFTYWASTSHRVWALSFEQAQTAVYLQISIAGHLAIFSTRTFDSWAITHPPSLVLLVGVALSQFIATLFAGFGFLMTALPWSHVGWIWLISLGTFVALDVVKNAFVSRIGSHQSLRGGVHQQQD